MADATGVLVDASLADLEARIERGLETFVDVGLALMEIRDRRLYRETHERFEDYCRERWGFRREVADRYVRAAGAVAAINPNGLPGGPTNEAQARELAPLAKQDPDAAREAWDRANEKASAEERPVTAADIRREVRGEPDQTPVPQKNPALYTSESPEWYTPDGIIDRTVKLLGRIDLDPCSNSHDDPNVPAAQHFTQQDDGLAQEWHGLVYMNPPYGGGIGDWIRKLVDSHRAGNVAEAVALLPARTDTAWFGQLREWPRCFISGRLKFSGHENSAPFPSVVVYLGERTDDFASVFGDVGDVYVRYGA